VCLSPSPPPLTPHTLNALRGQSRGSVHFRTAGRACYYAKRFRAMVFSLRHMGHTCTLSTQGRQNVCPQGTMAQFFSPAQHTVHRRASPTGVGAGAPSPLPVSRPPAIGPTPGNGSAWVCCEGPAAAGRGPLACRREPAGEGGRAGSGPREDEGTRPRQPSEPTEPSLSGSGGSDGSWNRGPRPRKAPGAPTPGGPGAPAPSKSDGWRLTMGGTAGGPRRRTPRPPPPTVGAWAPSPGYVPGR
jgi:hypothetical protein